MSATIFILSIPFRPHCTGPLIDGALSRLNVYSTSRKKDYSLWRYPTVLMNGENEVQTFERNEGQDNLIEAQTSVLHHLNIITELCSIPDSDISALDDSCTTKEQRAEFARKKSYADTVARAVDRPNVHRLLELVVHKLPRVGYISLIGELVFEKGRLRWKSVNGTYHSYATTGDIIETLCVFHSDVAQNAPFLLQPAVYKYLSRIKHLSRLSIWYVVSPISVTNGSPISENTRNFLAVLPCQLLQEHSSTVKNCNGSGVIENAASANERYTVMSSSSIAYAVDDWSSRVIPVLPHTPDLYGGFKVLRRRDGFPQRYG
eukprot:IDg5111t1